MSFAFSYSPDQDALIKQQNANALQSFQVAADITKSENEIARLKAQKRLSNYKAGIDDTSARDKEAQLSDYERRVQAGDYDLKNQITAWGAANKYRMSEADQSNVAQKDRLTAQLDTQKTMQDKTISQENRLRSDDYRRAVDGFKMNF